MFPKRLVERESILIWTNVGYKMITCPLYVSANNITKITNWLKLYYIFEIIIYKI